MTLPSTIVVPREREQYLSELRMGIRSIQSAVSALKAIADFTVPASASIGEWQKALDTATHRWEEANSAIASSPALTAEQKAESLKAWRAWHKVVATHVNGIIRRLNEWPQAKWKWDGSNSTTSAGKPSTTPR